MSGLLGPRGQPLAALDRAQAKKIALEAWILQALAGDEALGRGEHNFAQPPTAGMRQFVPGLNSRGISVYVGSGNLLLADLRGESPMVIQRRPLAQRYVKVCIQER